MRLTFDNDDGQIRDVTIEVDGDTLVGQLSSDEEKEVVAAIAAARGTDGILEMLVDGDEDEVNNACKKRLETAGYTVTLKTDSE